MTYKLLQLVWEPFFTFLEDLLAQIAPKSQWHSSRFTFHSLRGLIFTLSRRTMLYEAFILLHQDFVHPQTEINFLSAQ